MSVGSGAPPSLPPLHLWHPDRVRRMDLRIGKDGTWYHEGSPIGRSRMVRLFSTLLRREPEGFFLITPVEKIQVQVDLAPFIAVAVESLTEGEGPAVAFRTNVGDRMVVDSEHPLWVEEGERGPLPFVRVRDGLDALLGRSVFYELAESAEARVEDGREVYGVVSRGRFWVLGAAEA